MKDDALEDWWDSPLVRVARNGSDPGTGAVGVLQALSDLLATLDEIAPGVPYSELLTASSVDDRGASNGSLRARVLLGRYLLDIGVPQEDVEDLFCRVIHEKQPQPKHGRVSPFSVVKTTSFTLLERRYGHEQAPKRVAEMSARGMDAKVIASELKITPGTVYRHLRNLRKAS